MNTSTKTEALASLDLAMDDDNAGRQMSALARYFLAAGEGKTNVLRLVARASVEAGVPGGIAAEFARMLCGAGKTLSDAGMGK